MGTGQRRYTLIAIGVCGLVTVALIVVGLMTRASLSHMDDNPEEVGQLPYMYYAATGEEVALSNEYADEWDYRTLDYLEKDTPVVVEGVFTGERESGYLSFASSVRVTRVCRGDGVAEGDVIAVLEPASIRPLPGAAALRAESPDSWQAFRDTFPGENEVDPLVVVPSAPYTAGMSMMGEGTTYLFFLRPKEYPPEADEARRESVYLFENSPYARIALSPEGSGGMVAVADADKDYYSVTQAEALPFIVASEEDAAAYRERSHEIVRYFD